MATSIDALDIQISAKATSANNAINRLTKNLDKLSTSLNSLNVGNVKGLDKTLKSLANISNVSSNGATNITNLARALATLSANANNIPVLNRSLSGLSGSLARFMTTMSVAPSVNSNTLQMTQALAQLSRAGNNASATASNLANLGTQLRNFMQIMSTAPMVNQNTIQMTNALANLASQGSRVGRSSQSLVSGLNRTDRAMRTSTKSAWSLARAFGKFYANYFLVIRGAKALWGSIESTADYIESFNYYTVAFGKIASQWDENWDNYGSEGGRNYANSFVTSMNDTISKLSGVQIQLSDDYTTGILTDTGLKNLGLNIQEVTQYASQLASVSDAVGMTGEATLAMAKGATMLAGDVSSLFNVDFSNVATNIQAVLQGQSRAGYKYGWDTTLATLQKYADEFDLSKPVSEMTQLEKRYLRYIVVLKQSAVAHGDLANTINSPSNMIRQLSTNLKEAGMVLGQLFIPMLEHVLPVVNGATIALKRLLTEIAGFFGVEINFNEFGQGYNELEEDNSDLSDSYDDLANSIEEVKSQLLGFDEVNKLSDTSATLSVGTEDNTIDLTDEIVSATEEYQKVWDEAFKNMELSSSKWADRVQKALEGIGTVFEDFAIGDFFKAGEDVSKLVISFNNFIAKAIRSLDGEEIGRKFADFMLGIDYSGIAMSLADIVGSIFEGAWDFGWGIGDSLSSWLVDNDIKDFWDFGSFLGGDALSDWIIDMETFGDPRKYFTWSDENDAKLAEITDKYKSLNDQVARYIELSNNYDSLSDEDKSWVKQMGDELKNAGIVEGIDSITGAWTGTREELEKVIKNQMNYIKITANQEYLTELYAELARLEGKKNKLYGEQSDLSIGGYFAYLFGVDDAKMEGVESEIDSVLTQINYAQAQINYFEREIRETGEKMDDTAEDADGLSDNIYALGVRVNGLPKRSHLTLTADKTQYDTTIAGATNSYNNFKTKNGTLTTVAGVDASAINPQLQNLVNNWDATVNKMEGNQPKMDVSLDTSKAKTTVQQLVKDMTDSLKGITVDLGVTNSLAGIRNQLTNVSIKAYATGGFVDEGQLFIAREAGPELVGSMGGHTAVANNQQITDGIARAVYGAFTSALSATNRGSSGDIVINIDGKQVFKAVQRQANNYVAQTGQTPFPI